MAGGAANWARALTRAAIVIGTGVVLLKSRYNLSLTAATTPNEQQMYDVGVLFYSPQNLSPDLKRSVDAHRHAHERAAQSARIREQQSEVRTTRSHAARGAARHGQGQLAQVDTHILSVGKIYFCRDYLVSEGIIDAGGYKRVGLLDDTQP